MPLYRLGLFRDFLGLGIHMATADRLLGVIQAEIRATSQYLDQTSAEHESYDAVVDNECEHIEGLLGLAFVSCQNYLITVRTRVTSSTDSAERNSITGDLARGTKSYDAFHLGAFLRHDVPHTPIDIVNASRPPTRSSERQQAPTQGPHFSRGWSHFGPKQPTRSGKPRSITPPSAARFSWSARACPFPTRLHDSETSSRSEEQASASSNSESRFHLQCGNRGAKTAWP